MNETYDILYSQYEKDFPQTYMQWRMLAADISLAKVKSIMVDNIQDDVDHNEMIYAYRIVRHGKGGNII